MEKSRLVGVESPALYGIFLLLRRVDGLGDKRQQEFRICYTSTHVHVFYLPQMKNKWLYLEEKRGED